MAQFFYNFCFPNTDNDLENCGFYYLSHQESDIYSHTEFHTPDGPYSNIFRVKTTKDKKTQEESVFAYSHNKSVWVAAKVNHYPTSAYPLLLPKVGRRPLKYFSISESDHEIMGEVVLTRKGNQIVETLKGQVIRRFFMDDSKTGSNTSSEANLDFNEHVPTTIDWGGAVSFLCKNEIEAVKGTNITISQDILLK